MRVTKRVIPWRRVPLPVSLIVIAWTILFSQMQPSPLAPSSASAVNTVTLVDMNGCVDRDGDSFCDEWEIAGGIDLDGDGKIKKHDDAMLPDADVNKPDIYLQYDFMDWAAPGKPCKSDGECQIPSQPNEQCHKKFCSHNHEPDPAAIQMVVDAFAAHGINLHIDPVHNRVPHSQVVTFSKPGDGTNGEVLLDGGHRALRVGRVRRELPRHQGQVLRPEAEDRLPLRPLRPPKHLPHR